ncbi:hypothetical protein PWO46_07110 [Akkermansia muciniphila]|nr:MULTISPECIES: hypothetical protein [Akkermansia]AYR30849.1 hypothetical protein CUB96_08370 [Akkermansia muciniphila]MCD8247638.1 hypothetical protein [Akkermansia sp.]MCI7761513.1 hypothetical protein [Akkermansia muciniphila]MDY5393495.1 hypothetical protein [Akkermansia muciniphila]QEE54706.1 hypothetical protein FU653_07120 [Akkermansia muciniphila]
MSGMASSNKMRPETKPSQTSGYARSPGRINSRSGAIPPRPSRFSRTGTYHEPSFFIRTSSKTAYYCKKRNSPLNIKRSQSMRIHLRISNPQSIKFFEKKGLSSYRERKKSQRILKETIPNIDFIH